MADDDPETFVKNVENWVEKAKGNLRLFTIMFLQEVNVDVIISTPGPGNSIAVDPKRRAPTGFLRGSWFAQFNSVPGDKGAPDTAGAIAVARANLVAGSVAIGDTYYLVNTASYAARLEYGFVGTDSLGRRYNQAGRFWVKTTVSRADEIANRVANMIADGNWSAPTGGIAGGSFTTGPRA